MNAGGSIVTPTRLVLHEVGIGQRRVRVFARKSDNLGVGEDRGELAHATQVLFSEPTPIANLQLSPHCGDNLGAVLRALPLRS